MAKTLAAKENSEDDPYDLEYYEKTGGKTGEIIIQEIQDARREIHNNRMYLNNVFKYSMLAIAGLLVLNLVTLTLLSLMFVATPKEEKTSKLKFCRIRKTPKFSYQ